MKNRRKMNLILIIFILVLALGLGYAFLTTTLSINGTTDVDSNTWNVYWDNVQVTEGSVTAETPVISNQTTVSFSVHLSQPGDFYEFTVDAKNDGTIDAMIEQIIKRINNSTTIPSYLNYTVTYYDGIEVENNQLLKANTKETYKVRIEYRTDINPSDLPSAPTNLNIEFEVNNVQANSDAISLYTNYYLKYESMSSLVQSNINVGDNIPSDFILLDGSLSSKTSYGAIILIARGGKVNSFEMYMNAGNKDAVLIPGASNFEENKEKLNYLFGDSYCSTYDFGYRCDKANIYYEANISGTLSLGSQYKYIKISSSSATYGKQLEG